MDQTSTSEITHTRSSKEYLKSVNSSFGQILPHLDTLQEGSSVLWRRHKGYRSNLCNNNMSNVLYDSCMFPISSLTDGSHSCSGFYSPQLNNTTASNIKKHHSCLTSPHSVLYLREFAQTLFLWYAVLRGLFEAYPCVTILPQIDFQWILQTNRWPVPASPS